MTAPLKQEIAVVFGGTGFVGRQIVRELARHGYRVKVATRVPERAYFLRPCGMVGQVVPVACDYADVASLDAAMRGASLAVNCIGILYERGRGARFGKTQAELPGALGAAAQRAGVKRFVHISALGIEKSKSRYAASKLEGEKNLLAAFPRATILRPSVIFGEDDDFFNKFAELSRYLPFLPLIGGGETKFQPVYVGDVAAAAMTALTRPAVGEDNPQGKIYALGGPEVLSFRQIYERLFAYTGRKRMLVPLPFALAKIQAFFLGLLPTPLLTRDQVESLKTDSVVPPGTPGLKSLGVTPTALDLILPRYLEIYRAGGHFGRLKAGA